MVSKKFEVIARKLGVSVERVEDVFEHQIRRGVTPSPGSPFGSKSLAGQQVTPDFDVELDEETGRITVTLRNNIPALQISESYAMMNERYKKNADSLSVKEMKEKKVIQDAYNSASQFIEVLKQRQETLFKTMSAIVKCQPAYFQSGDERDLKSLGQQQIADMIGKDVSVVSRAISNKYVQTRWGVKSLKSFFSEDINGGSRHEVADDIRKLIDAEDKAHPLSDDALCEKLKAMGHKLERRTVAKYRSTLKIPSSSERRKRR
jgi:RNA polymerase sigma-54 factor